MNRFFIIILVFAMLSISLYTPNTVYANPNNLPDKIISLGSQGIGVIDLQKTLNTLGYNLEENGFYGIETRLAILDFQSNYPSLVNDGIYGPLTKSYLITSYPNDTEEIQQCELNINANLEEDRVLTYNAKLTGITPMVEQSFIDKNRDSLAEFNSPCTVVHKWNTTVPEGLKLNLEYNKYSLAYDYFLVKTNTLNVRSAPSTESKTIKKLAYFDKVNLIQEVKGEYLHKYNSDSWYRVFWHENGKINTGFVFSKLGTPRTYRFDEMLDEIKYLQNTIGSNEMAYIYNYKNRNGYPPAYQGLKNDSYGVSRSQSAPGYIDLEKSDFRYFSDGMLVSILEELDNYYKVVTPSFEGEYFIPKKYISFKNAPKELKKVIVIDDINQNEGVFQLVDGTWELISYTYATTGITGTYSYETPKGHFMAIQKKPYFLYLEDGTSNIGGFAPYTVRFSGGGYIHGVPIDFKEGQTHNNTDLTDPKNYEEYLFTIGTTPRSHKCVRNFTSHAKFLYDWVEIGETAVIVID